LHSIDVYTYAGQKTATCLVVDVDDIAYLYNPKREPAEKTPSPKKSNLQEKFKNRKCLQYEAPSSPTSTPSIAPKQSGKRARRSSEDEVDERV
jgi:hypothetical protein